MKSCLATSSKALLTFTAVLEDVQKNMAISSFFMKLSAYSAVTSRLCDMIITDPRDRGECPLTQILRSQENFLLPQLSIGSRIQRSVYYMSNKILGNVVDQNHSCSIPIKALDYAPKALLPSSVPNLQLHFAILINVKFFSSELNPFIKFGIPMVTLQSISN